MIRISLLSPCHYCFCHNFPGQICWNIGILILSTYWIMTNDQCTTFAIYAWLSYETWQKNREKEKNKYIEYLWQRNYITYDALDNFMWNSWLFWLLFSPLYIPYIRTRNFSFDVFEKSHVTYIENLTTSKVIQMEKRSLSTSCL